MKKSLAFFLLSTAVINCSFSMEKEQPLQEKTYAMQKAEEFHAQILEKSEQWGPGIQSALCNDVEKYIGGEKRGFWGKLTKITSNLVNKAYNTTAYGPSMSATQLCPMQILFFHSMPNKSPKDDGFHEIVTFNEKGEETAPFVADPYIMQKDPYDVDEFKELDGEDELYKSSGIKAFALNRDKIVNLNFGSGVIGSYSNAIETRVWIRPVDNGLVEPLASLMHKQYEEEIIQNKKKALQFVFTMGLNQDGHFVTVLVSFNKEDPQSNSVQIIDSFSKAVSTIREVKTSVMNYMPSIHDKKIMFLGEEAAELVNHDDIVKNNMKRVLEALKKIKNSSDFEGALEYALCNIRKTVRLGFQSNGTDCGRYSTIVSAFIAMGFNPEEIETMAVGRFDKALQPLSGKNDSIEKFLYPEEE